MTSNPTDTTRLEQRNLRDLGGLQTRDGASVVDVETENIAADYARSDDLTPRAAARLRLQ
jgi:hypothetical protein